MSSEKNDETGQTGNHRQQDTLARIKAALMAERIAVTDITGEDTGTDPYNSSGRRAAGYAWGNRTR